MSADTAGQGDGRGRGGRPWLLPALIAAALFGVLLLLFALGALILRARGGGGEPTQTTAGGTTRVVIGSPGAGTSRATRTPGGTAGAPTSGVAAPPTATPPAPSARRFFEVSGTEGDGVILRREPGGQQLDIYDDGTRLEQIGPDREVDGVTWRNVRAPDGTEGWVAAQFTTPVP